MLPAKFQDHMTYGSWEEKFLGVLPYMAMAVISLMWPGTFPKVAPYKIWL